MRLRIVARRSISGWNIYLVGSGDGIASSRHSAVMKTMSWRPISVSAWRRAVWIIPFTSVRIRPIMLCVRPTNHVSRSRFICPASNKTSV